MNAIDIITTSTLLSLLPGAIEFPVLGTEAFRA